MKTHGLRNVQTDKIFILTLNDKKVSIESGKAGKTRVAEKEFPTEAEALTYFEKKEWEALKKGFILKDEDPLIGQPALHYFVGSGYTGCLSFEGTPNGIYVYKHGWYKAPDDQKDFLVVLDTSGILLDTIELPKILPWNILYNPATHSLLLTMDHCAFDYQLDSREFSQLTSFLGRAASFIAISENTVAYATHPTLVFCDKKGNVRLEQDFTINIVKGSIPFCAALSKKGDVLALHNQIGEIQLMDTEKGNVLRVLVGDFQMITQMEFIEEDTILVIKEQYGNWRVRFFDLKNKSEVSYPTLEIPGWHTHVNSFCFNSDQSKLALIQANKAFIFDFRTKELSHSFKVEHCVRSAKPKFIGDLLGFRTDYGCFSLYKV